MPNGEKEEENGLADELGSMRPELAFGVEFLFIASKSMASSSFTGEQLRG